MVADGASQEGAGWCSGRSGDGKQRRSRGAYAQALAAAAENLPLSRYEFDPKSRIWPQKTIRHVKIIRKRGTTHD